MVNDDPNLRERSSLLTELFAAQERQTRLHHELSELISEEVAVSHYLIDAQTTGAFVSLKPLFLQATADFNQRGAAITGELNDTHEEIRRILEGLRELRENKP